jgi:hypothetical protein
MASYERKIKNIMKTEHCDRAKAKRFLELSNRMTSTDFTSELGKQIYLELETLRKTVED